ncbi:MAG: LysM peptidoglycan-binding domain-containing protein [Clostridia bacterium]|nr:LysM peptidoglycan-binding domain-containing protein [Clostridia bacterium]
MYRFILQREKDGVLEDIEFPLAPKQFKTKVGNKNKTIELVSVGEVNIPKDIGLREFSFEILLPKDDTLVTGSKLYVDSEGNEVGYMSYAKMNFHEPIWYLSRLREIKADKNPVFLVIIRQIHDGINADGSYKLKYLFGGNLKVTIEDYTVEENAGEEGDYWVSIKLKEYREVGVIKTLEETGKTDADGKVEAVETPVAEKPSLPETYTVKKDDTLCNIALKFYNDSSKYKYLAELNNLENANKIYIGQVLKLIEPTTEKSSNETDFTANKEGDS